MKTKLFALIATLFIAGFATQLNAQNVMGQGSKIINVGAGIGSDNVPLFGSFDYGLVGNLFDQNSALSVGGLVSVGFGSNHTQLHFGPRVGLHYHFIPQLDTYFDLMLGYKHTTDHSNGIKDSKGRFGWGAHLGIRYMFTPAVGAFLEAGYGISFVSMGLSFSL